MGLVCFTAPPYPRARPAPLRKLPVFHLLFPSWVFLFSCLAPGPSTCFPSLCQVPFELRLHSSCFDSWPQPPYWIVALVKALARQVAVSLPFFLPCFSFMQSRGGLWQSSDTPGVYPRWRLATSPTLGQRRVPCLNPLTSLLYAGELLSSKQEVNDYFITISRVERDVYVAEGAN